MGLTKGVEATKNKITFEVFGAIDGNCNQLITIKGQD